MKFNLIASFFPFLFIYILPFELPLKKGTLRSSTCCLHGGPPPVLIGANQAGQEGCLCFFIFSFFIFHFSFFILFFIFLSFFIFHFSFFIFHFFIFLFSFFIFHFSFFSFFIFHFHLFYKNLHPKLGSDTHHWGGLKGRD